MRRRRTTKRKCGIFTIVKDEKFFLPIWLRYYKQFFEDIDIYVLNHQSTDGSTENINVNVINVSNEVHFDHKWLVATVQNFQKELLQKYQAVIFAEADEILYGLNQNLNDLIDTFISSKHKFITCNGYEIMQKLEIEKPISNTDSILLNRNYWFKEPMVDKTLLSKVPLEWSVGFHKCNYTNYYSNLYMAHLHRVDFNMMLERHHLRSTKWNLCQEDLKKKWGWHHAIGDKDGVLKIFNMHVKDIVEIPTDHKNSLTGL